jgi:hypothetical protein
VFVRLSDDTRDDRGFTALLEATDTMPSLVAALIQPIAASADLIVENAFDGDHFTALHKVPKVAGMDAVSGESGELVIDGEFLMQTSPWQDEQAKEDVRWASVRTGVVTWDYRPRFFARAFSPGIVVTEFGPPENVQIILTAAVPAATGCVARVAVGVPAGRESDLPWLIAGSHKALAEDRVIWENLDPDHEPRYDRRDSSVIAFHEFCAGFGQLA